MPAAKPSIISPAGFTSIVEFTAPNYFDGLSGYYSLLCWRQDGGGVVVPFVVEL